MTGDRFGALYLFGAVVWFFPLLNAQKPAVQPEGTAQREAGAPQGPGGRGPGGRGFPPVTHGLGMQAAGFVLDPAYDKTPPELPADLKSGGVLIFSKTNGFRDEPAIQASDSALAAIAKLRALPYFVTENGAVMNQDQLGRFNLVIWNNTSGDTLNEQQRAAFRSWVENGGTYIGLHGAGGDPAPVGPRAERFAGIRSASAWKWYVDNLVGAQFIGHAHIQPADIHVEDTKSRLTQGLPALWRRSDEWYAFGENPRNKSGYHVVASVNEKSYDPDSYSMGGDHPSVWWHCVGKGRALFSALGHGAEMYQEPLMIQFLDNAIAWASRQSGQACAGQLAP